MIAKFQSLSKTAEDPWKIVMLRLKAGCEYNAFLQENPQSSRESSFTFNVEECCIYQEPISYHKADLMCFGRCVIFCVLV